MLTARLCRLLIGGLVALLALAPASSALATAPDIQRFQLQGAIPHFVDCGTFFINAEFETTVSVTTFFDEAGNPVRLKIHEVFNGQLINEMTGKTLRDTPRYTLFVDLQDGTETYMGSTVHWTIPGVGRITLDAGRIIFDSATGQVLFEAGQHPSFGLPGEEFEARLCSALAD